jgi:hypothetical protein
LIYGRERRDSGMEWVREGEEGGRECVCGNIRGGERKKKRVSESVREEDKERV